MNLGDPAASLKNYEKALAIFQRQWEADRVNRGAVVNLAIVHLHIGDALLAMKKLPEALKSYRQGLPHMEHLVKEDDANAMYKHNLFAFHERIGVIEAQIGTPPDALAQFHAALEIAQGLVRASPGNAQFQNNLAIVNLRVATVAAETGEGADAVAHSRSGLKIMQDLARLDPNSAEALRNLRTAYHDIGQVYELLGGNNAEPVSKQTEDIQSARSFYNDGLALTARLTKAGILRADDALSQELKEGVQWCDEAIKALSAR
jgi:tetratricopeptide (TPR) repeat protein